MKTFILFGATGDLATRYVLPALGNLLLKKSFDHLICVGRRDWKQEDFENFLVPYWSLLSRVSHISYVRIDVDGVDYSALKDEIQSIGGLEGDLIYHLCLSPEHFAPVAQWIASTQLNTKKSILMIEKPFWHDLKSAILLNLELQRYFRENQIFRVDHYLGKNFVQELLAYRLSQWGDWYHDRIKSITIVSREKITIEDRGEYYDQSGVTRDFLQNHLLQVLAIATMRMPIVRHDSDVVEEEDQRDRIFQAISNIIPLLVDPRHDIVMGQYKGYRETSGVSRESQTPTYIRVRLTVDDVRWTGTEIILESGKALDRKESSVKIFFQDGTEKTFSETDSNKNNAYETIITKAINNDSTSFVRWDSVRAAWQVVDELLHCTDNCPLLQFYSIGTKNI